MFIMADKNNRALFNLSKLEIDFLKELKQ